MSRYILAFLPAFLALITQPAVADGPVEMGLENHAWNSLYLAGGKGSRSADRMKVQMYESNLDQYKWLGATWDVVRADQDTDGPDGFRRLDAIVAQHRKRGLEVVLRLIEDPDVYTELSDTESPVHGYNERYWKWVHSIAGRYGDRVKIYLVGNEIDKDISVNLPRKRRHGPIYVDYAKYKKLLTTAYKAIKAVNPELLVADHGAESYSLLSVVVEDLVKSGNPDEAVDLCRKAFYYRVEYDKECRAFPRRLIFDRSLATRTEKARKTFLDPGPADLFQVHLYMNAEAMPSILAWIAQAQKRDGISRPLIATEVSYLLPSRVSDVDGRRRRVADMARYSEDEHAEQVVKMFATLFGHHVRRAEYWESRTFAGGGSPVSTLFHDTDDPTLVKPYKAAKAYGTLGSTIAGAESRKPIGFCGEQCIEYRFVSHRRDVSIVWAKTKGSTIELDLNGTDIDLVTDIYGTPVRKAGKRIQVGYSPIYLIRATAR